MLIKFQTLLDLEKCCLILNTNRNPIISPFMFDLLLQQLIKDKLFDSIIIVLLSQNLQHYIAVHMKCGLNLRPFIDNGMIHVVDTFNIEDDKELIDIDQLSAIVRQKLASNNEQNKKTFILFDDIQVFDSLQISARKVYIMIKEIQKILYENGGKIFISISLITTTDDQSVKWNQLINSFIYECDYWIDCDCPRTGYSQHINGILRHHNRQEQSLTDLNYKLSNRNVIFTKL